MAEWTHNICSGCWVDQEGEREAVRLKEPYTALCCWCGASNRDGIYKRGDPAETPCKGKHG